jgi:hypothetical protein
MANSEAIAVILQRICTSLLQCHSSRPSRSSIPAVYRTSLPQEIPSRRLGRELLVDNVEVALDCSEVGAWLIDLAQVERVFGVVGMPRILPAFG